MSGALEAGTTSSEPIVVGATTLYEAFRAAVSDAPDREAIIWRGRSYTYAELDRNVTRTVAMLRQRGVERGNRVVLLSTPRPEVSMVLLACAALGAIYVGMGTRSTYEDFRRVIGDTRPDMVIALESFEGREYRADLEAACGDGIETIFFSRDADPAELAGAEVEGAPALPELDGGSPLAIIYTSGTTGVQKGAVISHGGLIQAYGSWLGRHRFAAPRVLAMHPIDHIGFLGNEFAICLLSGGTLVQLERFDAGAVLEAVQTHRVSVWMAVPTMLHRVIHRDDFGTYDLSSLDLVWWGGPLGAEELEVLRRVSRDVATSYGMSEATGAISLTAPNPTDEELAGVGRPLAVEVRLRKVGVTEDGDEMGEVELRGAQMMLGYWGKGPAEDPFDADGWFPTGDLATMVDGALRIIGRTKETIRTGGYNVVPTEVEALLLAHPDVAEVTVVGVPDAEYGEAVHAAVKASPGAILDVRALDDYARGLMAGYKRPKRYTLLEELDYRPNGKKDRKATSKRLREIYAGGAS